MVKIDRKESGLCRIVTKYLISVFTISFVSGCVATASPEATSIGNPSVITSAREFIRIRHEINNADAANEMAIKWCQEQNLSVEKTNSSCSGPCITTYQCR